MGSAITLSKISKTFGGEVRAVESVDLEIERGEFLAMIGPSGCGKSTLLRIIAGLEKPTSGTVEVDRSTSHLTTKEALDYYPSSQAPIAYVFQDAHLLPWRNVMRNVALPLELMGVGKSERIARAMKVLELVGLSDFARRYPAQLSGGMKMRASLARALVTDPQLLLLDEPFAALDEITRQRLDDLLREIWLTRRITVLFVTHSIAEATFLARRAIVFSARPARIVLDRAMELPEQRPAEIRTEQAFAREMRVLFGALEGT